MVTPLLAWVALQSPLVSRDLRVGLERRYRVELTGSAGEAYRYRMRAKVAPPEKEKKDDGPKLDLSLTDYRVTIEGRETHAARAGGGLLPLSTAGLPRGFGLAGAQGALWLPLVAFYVPATVAEGPFDVEEIALSDGGTLGGKGTLSKDRRIDLDATLSREGQAVATIKAQTTLDAAGWPVRSEGTMAGASGTVSFRLTKG